MTPPTPQAAAAIASLPITYDTALRSRIRSVSGESGWAERAAAELQAQPDLVVVVERPVRASTAVLDGLESRVVLDSAWGHNPAVTDAAAVLRRSTNALVEAHFDVPALDDLHQWVFEGLLLLDALVGVTALEIVDSTADRLVATGTAEDGRAISVTAARTDTRAGTAKIRSVGAEQTITAEFPDPFVARPPLLRTDSETQLVVTPTSWETASRGAWRAAASQAANPLSAPQHDLSSYRAQLQHLPLR